MDYGCPPLHLTLPTNVSDYHSLCSFPWKQFIEYTSHACHSVYCPDPHLRHQVGINKYTFSHICQLMSVLSSSTFAGGGNCKCQDAAGQYDELTEVCCDWQIENVSAWITFPGPNHQVCLVLATHRDVSTQNNQCVSVFNSIDINAFAQCCQSNGINCAWCW